MKYHQLLFDLLARQYEAARMDEAKSAPVIQVVDPALVPDRKVGAIPGIVGLVGRRNRVLSYRRLGARVPYLPTHGSG